MNNRIVLIVAVVALAVCAGAIWFLQRDTPEPPPITGAATPSPVDRSPEGAATIRPQTPFPPATPRPGQQDAPTETAAMQPPPMTEWERRIEQVLDTQATEVEQAQLLINLLPTLPADGQTEAAQHITNLILDEDYHRVQPLVKNPNLPEETLDVFLTDLMNRDEKLMLPSLLEIARQPNHPHHEEALADLEIFLDEDHGNDFAKWESTMKAYLKKQADEEAEEMAASPPVQ